MEISFHGAAQTVTGSKHIIKLKNGKKILLDCGMFQGMGHQTNDLNRQWGFHPDEIDYFILSHAHIDHTGLIPKLVEDGYGGKIHCTTATKDIADILLRDSAQIQEADIRFVNKQRKAEGKTPLQPLYREQEVERALKRFEIHPYNRSFKIDDDIEVTFTDAGHILGSAIVSLKIREGGEVRRICFTGDVGRYNNRILYSPQPVEQADIVICESTYGNKLHDSTEFSEQELYEIIQEAVVVKQGKLIIPAFSVGRTQEVLFVLNKLELAGKLPNVRVYLDSPLSNKATDITRQYPELYNKRVQDLMKTDDDVFGFRNLMSIVRKEDSQALNDRNEPCIIISASGMAEAGRVKHHIAHAISNPKHTILFIGYAEPRSLGGRLQRGAQSVRIFGTEFSVRADIKVLHSFSAHGDYEDLCQFLADQDPKQVQKFFVVHGEPDTQNEFAERMHKKGYHEVFVPYMHEHFYV